MDKEWLKRRKIGSSDAPIIMEESPYSTPLQLWERKLTSAEVKKNSAMQRGTDLEPIARAEFEKKMNVILFPREMTHLKYDFMTANLDGLDLEEEVLVEIKCPGKEDHEVAKQGKVPQKYYAQCQHQLEVTGLQGMYYFSFDGANGVIVEVTKDASYTKIMIEKEQDFWECLQTFTPPELIARDYVNQDNNSEWIEIALELEEIKREKEKLKELEEQEKELIAKLVEISDGKNAIGNGRKLQKIIRKGVVDYSRVPGIQGIDVDLYRKNPTNYWKFV